MRLKILLVDDRQLVRAGFAALLQARPDLTVVGEAASGEEALALAYRLAPDLALVDVTMPGPSGIELTRCLTKELPALRVLMLTMHEDATMLHAAMEAGARGYLIKTASPDELFEAIDTVVRGDLYVHPKMLRVLLVPSSRRRDRGAERIKALTPRQLEVLRLIARGYTNAQMAGELFLSVRTIEYHRRNLMEALGLDSRADLVRFALEQGLLNG